MRYFFQISYKGTNYHGWQIQQNAISIQQVIQKQLKVLANEDIDITGSGRTDAGVHAKQQFFHVDLKTEIETDDFGYHLNAILPKDILVRAIRKVKPEAHARFDATSRSYEYHILPHKDPFKINEAYIYYRKIHLEKLNAAADMLLGKHNFESFSKVKTQVNNFNCEVYGACWKREGEAVVFHINANRFLRGMVRATVGTLLMVNEGKMDVAEIHDILESQDRSKAGRSVPAEGLYLSNVVYPVHVFEN